VLQLAAPSAVLHATVQQLLLALHFLVVFHFEQCVLSLVYSLFVHHSVTNIVVIAYHNIDDTSSELLQRSLDAAI
jgi:hypothetical protein